MQNSSGSESTKKPIGVGRRKSPPKGFEGGKTLGSAVEALNSERDEGEFCSPLPMNGVSPDPDNSREIISYITQRAEDVRSTEYQGKRIIDFIHEDEDVTDIPYDQFLDHNHMSKETGYGQEQIREYWKNLLLLARSVYHNGLKQPISVRRDGDSRNKYVITYGHRRYLAHYLIFAKTIRGVIANTDQKQDHLKNSIDRALENINNQSLNFWEQYLDYKNIVLGWKGRYGKRPSNRELSKIISSSRQTIDRVAAVHKADEGGILTRNFEYAIKNNLIYRTSVPGLVNYAIENGYGPKEFDQYLSELMTNEEDSLESQENDTALDGVNGSEGKPGPIAKVQVSKKANRKPSAQIKIKDVDFGRRVIKALSSEFKELGDIDVDDINSIDDVKALLKRLM